MAGIRDVADRAGVSVATVSRTINRPDDVKRETRQQVLDAVEALNYRPNAMARNFRSRRSYAVVVLVPNIANPFFSAVVRGIEQVAQRNGYAVLLGDTQGDPDREDEYLALVASNQADGIIQLSARLDRKKLSRLWRDGSGPAIVNACECVDRPFCPSVRLDNVRAAQTLTEHLLSLGHRRIAAVLGPPDSPLTRDRLRGYRLALRAAGVLREPNYEISGDFSIQSGDEAGRRVLALNRRPTAVFCFNDEMALGMLHRMQNAGVAVPEELSVAGFDDIEFARFAVPPLTTIAQPMGEIGEKAMGLLVEALEGRRMGKKAVVLQGKLVRRRSTAEVPR